MLTHVFLTNHTARQPSSLPSKQSGVVLMVALIILVALTLAGIALVRSVDTTNTIAGNLAFQQAATFSGEAGLEDAISSFLEVSTPAALQNDSVGTSGHGYSASVTNPADWDAYWSATINPHPVSTPNATRQCLERVCTLPTDAVGNTVSYTIQRLCQTAGDPYFVTTGCSSNNQSSALAGASTASGSPQLTPPPQYYYRITARIEGPRNTLSYVQTIVAK